jgi:type IX secretion system PorP/SprF family membrane protein
MTYHNSSIRLATVLKRNIIVFASIIFLLPTKIYSQDIQYTQFDYSQLLLNPANTGDFKGDWRASANFRNQRVATSKPFTTAMASFDKKFYVLNQKIGVGLFFINDKSGEGGLVFNKIYGSAAYSRNIDNNFISLGMQAGFSFGSFKPWGIWERTGFTAPSGEPNENLNSRYLDLNIGALYKRNILDLEPEIGVSFAHINKPKNSLLGDNTKKEAIKISVYSCIKKNISDEIYITPKLLFSRQGKSSLTVVGSNAGYNLLGNRSNLRTVYGGLYLLNGIKGMSVQAGATISRIDLIINYDIPISKSSLTGNMGAFEISLIFKGISTVLNSYSIPCERF